MTKFVPSWKLTSEERQEVADMTGKIMLWIMERRSMDYMSEQLKLHPMEIERNIEEILYELRKQVGWRRYLRILFWK